jgi:hypothetical protein
MMTTGQYHERLGKLISKNISKIFGKHNESYEWEMCEEHLKLALSVVRSNLSFSNSSYNASKKLHDASELFVTITVEDGDDISGEWGSETKPLSKLLIDDIKFYDREYYDYAEHAAFFRAGIIRSLDIMDAWIAKLPPLEQTQ